MGEWRDTWPQKCISGILDTFKITCVEGWTKGQSGFLHEGQCTQRTLDGSFFLGASLFSPCSCPSLIFLVDWPSFGLTLSRIEPDLAGTSLFTRTFSCDLESSWSTCFPRRRSIFGLKSLKSQSIKFCACSFRSFWEYGYHLSQLLSYVLIAIVVLRVDEDDYDVYQIIYDLATGYFLGNSLSNESLYLIYLILFSEKI